MYNPIEIQTIKDYQIETLEDLPKLKLMMEVLGMEANFSQLARELVKDRRTVKKYYDGFEKVKQETSPDFDSLIFKKRL